MIIFIPMKKVWRQLRAMTSKFFNLIDEKWINTVDKGFVSLHDVFSNPEIKNLGGTAIEKLSVFKLLLAIAQSAYTPKNDLDWNNYSNQDMALKVSSYLNKFYDRFFLYSDDTPFLQFPVLSSMTKLKEYAFVQPHIASGNNVLRTQSECAYKIDENESARILVGLMNFAFGGKQVDNKISLTPGYESSKSQSGKVGIGLNNKGYLHSYFLGTSLIESIRLNLLTSADIDSLNMFPSGVGIPLWEKMPKGEDDDIARCYKQSLLGRLVSLGRFCLLQKDGLYLTEGLSYLDHKDGVCDPSVTTDTTKSDIKAIWSNPEKSPWRSLPAILSFISVSQPTVKCQQLQLCRKRICHYQKPIAIWSSGQRVTNKSGEFRVSGRDDSVDSIIWLEDGNILSEDWYEIYSDEVSSLEHLSSQLYISITGYLKELKRSEKEVNKYIYNFWSNIEPYSQEISDSCDDLDKRKSLRLIFASFAEQIYNDACPCCSEAQFKAWTKHQIDTFKYIQMGR